MKFVSPQSVKLNINGGCDEKILRRLLERFFQRFYSKTALPNPANDEWASAVAIGLELNAHFRRLSGSNRLIAVEFVRQLELIQNSPKEP